MIQLPEDYMPEWVKMVVATVFGAGGVHFFRAWLENRRLAKKDFRELLLDRIKELETVIDGMHTRMGNLRTEMAHLAVENEQFKRQRDDDKQPKGGDHEDPK